MRLFIEKPIKMRKRLTQQELALLKSFSIWNDRKQIQEQKCTVPEEDMHNLIQCIDSVSLSGNVMGVWKHNWLYAYTPE